MRVDYDALEDEARYLLKDIIGERVTDEIITALINALEDEV
ncbi:unnamed protein product, partial [Rotaria sp. Silwood2]